jgi:fructosamine-3-kinase
VHGDFWLAQFGGTWYGNVLFAADGTPIFIDPAASYNWAECDLANFTVYISEIPDAFLGPYREVNPLPDGTAERLPILQVHDRLQIIEHTDDMPEFRIASANVIREVIARFA